MARGEKTPTRPVSLTPRSANIVKVAPFNDKENIQTSRSADSAQVKRLPNLTNAENSPSKRVSVKNWK